jgi:hypothetical protein
VIFILPGTHVPLDWYDVSRAAQIGCMRNIDSLQSGSKNKNNLDDTDNWTLHIEGAAGELAVCRHAHVPWPALVGHHKMPDVRIGKRWYQVKTNKSRRWTDLIVKRDDPDEHPYIGVLSYLPNFYITGWLPAEEIKQDKWWRDPIGGRPAYFVPHDQLRPIDELLKQEAA